MIKTAKFCSHAPCEKNKNKNKNKKKQQHNLYFHYIVIIRNDGKNNLVSRIFTNSQKECDHVIHIHSSTKYVDTYKSPIFTEMPAHLRVQNEQFSEEKGFVLRYTEKEV